MWPCCQGAQFLVVAFLLVCSLWPLHLDTKHFCLSLKLYSITLSRCRIVIVAKLKIFYNHNFFAHQSNLWTPDSREWMNYHLIFHHFLSSPWVSYPSYFLGQDYIYFWWKNRTWCPILQTAYFLHQRTLAKPKIRNFNLFLNFFETSQMGRIGFELGKGYIIIFYFSLQF